MIARQSLGLWHARPIIQERSSKHPRSLARHQEEQVAGPRHLSRLARNVSPCFDLAPKERESGVHLSRTNRMHGNRADPAMTERNERQTAPYPAEKARGGEIILRTPLRRAIFIAGLAGAAVLALLLGFARFAH
jgi:hypothetical protein